MKYISKLYYTVLHYVIYNIIFFIKKIVMKKKKLSGNSYVAVHLHLYHIGLANEFISYLKNIPFSFDLYVTIPVVIKDDIDITKFKENFNTVKFLICENKGKDIGGFFCFLHNINLDDYDIILKLHSKKHNAKFVNTKLSQGKYFKKSRFKILDNDLWRKHNLSTLIGSEKTVNDIITLFKRQSIGMIGDKVFLLNNRYANYSERRYFKKICKKCNLIPCIYFFAGTMFWIRADLLKSLKENYNISDFNCSSSSIKEGELEHGFERVFGTLVKTQGYDVKGI